MNSEADASHGFTWPQALCGGDGWIYQEIGQK
jgi:hypothetical protein